MYNIGQYSPMLGWQSIEAPADAPSPEPMTVRAQAVTARSYFPEHSHDWGQLVYAISGVLAVGITGQSFVISPEQAVWLPAGITHRVGSLLGAQFRSLWIANEVVSALPEEPAVYPVGALLKALIAEAANLHREEDDHGYADRVTTMILDQLRRATPISAELPWPRSEPLARLCEALYADPADPRSAEDWGRDLGMSSRTLSRRFEAEIGMSLRSWRRRMRLFKAIELLGGGEDVTRTAMDLGYGSPSAFIFAFRTEMGASPRSYMREEIQI
ncbi:AraC family transcriptional regulator [Novosphingobium panipatense]|nr:helix-turn-helix transcriptional regulator [Novosphingobium panipatense]